MLNAVRPLSVTDVFPLSYVLPFLCNIGRVFVAYLNAVEWVCVSVCAFPTNSSSIYTPGLNTDAKKGEKKRKVSAVHQCNFIMLSTSDHTNLLVLLFYQNSVSV